MPAAVAIPALIGAAGVGANLYGAKKGADAAKTAAKTQQDATTKAQDFNREAWEAQQKALNPYQQAGQYSLAALMARQYGGSASNYLPPQGYGAPQGPPQGGNPMSLAAMQGGGTQNMNAGAVGMMNAPQGAFGGMPPGGGGMPPQGMPFMDGHALMVGPDGDLAHVPHHRVDEALRRGANHHGGAF